MPARFCPGCGTKTVAGAKFCADCGTSLIAGGGSASSRRVTVAGAAVLGVFLAAGLTVWTLILLPATQKPALGGAVARPPGPATAGAQLPEGHPQVPVQLPAEVKTFIADLAAKTKDKPKDAEAWLKLGNVTARASQLDQAYAPDAVAAFQHVLELDPKNADALRGLANMHYDRDDYKEAIPIFERYLALRPDDPSARTDLGTMYLYAGDQTRAVASYQDVIKRNPSFMQAHYNLAVTYHRQGNDEAAIGELNEARGLAADDDARKQIDEMLANLRGESAPKPATGPAAAAAGDGTGAPRSPFQSAVETAFRGHPIMGPRIVRIEWSGPAAGRVMVRNFPMEGMPPAVREKFAAHLGEQLRTAQETNHVDGPVRMEIADASSGTVMATVTP